VEYEKNIAELQAIEANAQKTAKNLTALRESMVSKLSFINLIFIGKKSISCTP